MEKIDCMGLRCLKYRLYPSKSQQTAMQEMLETCRQVYNSLLHWRKYAYDVGDKVPTCYQQQAAIASWKARTDQDGNLCHPELRNVNAQALQNVAERVNLAFNAFFRRLKKGEKPGYPRCKGEDQYDSLTYKQEFKVEENSIRFSKIGRVKAIIHRSLFGKTKQCVLRRQGEEWYACVLVEVADQPLPMSEETVGMDMGIEKFAVLSNGEVLANPRFLRKQERRLAKAQRKLEYDKNNRQKAQKHRKTVSRIHKQIRNQRHDFLHQMAHRLVNRYGIFFLEELNVRNMSQRPAAKQDAQTGVYQPNGASQKSGLNKSILDAAWSMFRRILTEKAARAGRKVVEINPAYTSQDCYLCGYRVKKKLSDRWHLCPQCGACLDRDLNSALGLWLLGLKRLKLPLPDQKELMALGMQRIGASP